MDGKIGVFYAVRSKLISVVWGVNGIFYRNGLGHRRKALDQNIAVVMATVRSKLNSIPQLLLVHPEHGGYLKRYARVS